MRICSTVCDACKLPKPVHDRRIEDRVLELCDSCWGFIKATLKGASGKPAPVAAPVYVPVTVPTTPCPWPHVPYPRKNRRWNDPQPSWLQPQITWNTPNVITVTNTRNETVVTGANYWC